MKISFSIHAYVNFVTPLHMMNRKARPSVICVLEHQVRNPTLQFLDSIPDNEIQSRIVSCGET